MTGLVDESSRGNRNLAESWKGVVLSEEQTDLQQRLLKHLRETFPGPGITDALCNAEQLARKYHVTALDEEGLRKCVGEAIELTHMEMEGQRRHTCPEPDAD